MHFHNSFYFPFPRKPNLGTQRYPNSKEMHQNIQEMHIHIAKSRFTENPRIPSFPVQKCKKHLFLNTINCFYVFSYNTYWIFHLSSLTKTNDKDSHQKCLLLIDVDEQSNGFLTLCVSFLKTTRILIKSVSY